MEWTGLYLPVGASRQLSGYFILGIKTQPIKKGESISSDRDRYLGAKLNIASRLTANNWPDVGLIDADDAVRDTSAFRVEKNGLLSDQLADNQKLLIGISPSRLKACTTGSQGINAVQIALEMAKLLIDRFADRVDSGSLLFCHGKKLFPGSFTACSWLMTKGLSDLWMHPIDQCLCQLSSLIQKREIGWVSNIRSNTCRINEQ